MEHNVGVSSTFSTAFSGKSHISMPFQPVIHDVLNISKQQSHAVSSSSLLQTDMSISIGKIGVSGLHLCTFPRKSSRNTVFYRLFFHLKTGCGIIYIYQWFCSKISGFSWNRVIPCCAFDRGKPMFLCIISEYFTNLWLKMHVFAVTYYVLHFLGTCKAQREYIPSNTYNFGAFLVEKNGPVQGKSTIT